MMKEMPQFETDFTSGIESIIWQNEMMLAFPRGRHEDFRSRPARVTVFLPVFNAEARLLRCLQSIDAQTFEDYQVVVVDNCSTDQTFPILCKFAEAHPKFIVYQNARNLGRIENWNRGLSFSRGEYIKPLMVNDYLLPDCLGELSRVLDENPDAAMARCSMTTLSNGVLNFEPLFSESKMHSSQEAIEFGITAGNIAAGPSAQMHRHANITSQNLRFDSRYDWASDFEFTMRLFASGGIYYLRQSLFVYEYTKRYATKSKLDVELHDEVSVIGSMLTLYRDRLPQSAIEKARTRAMMFHKNYRVRCTTDEEQSRCDEIWEQALSAYPILQENFEGNRVFVPKIGPPTNSELIISR